jgi:hypothetical protein
MNNSFDVLDFSMNNEFPTEALIDIQDFAHTEGETNE